MKLKLLILTVLVGALLMRQGSAKPENHRMGYFQTGNELYTLCNSESYYDKGKCLGYIQGAADLISGLQSSLSTKDHQPMWRMNDVCGSSNVTSRQVKDVVTLYLRDHPADRDQPAAQLITIALIQTFPCDDQK
jgi:hypothetical protein